MVSFAFLKSRLPRLSLPNPDIPFRNVHELIVPFSIIPSQHINKTLVLDFVDVAISVRTHPPLVRALPTIVWFTKSSL